MAPEEQKDWQGITVEEFVEDVETLLRQAVAHYGDDHKLTPHEIVHIIGPGFGEEKGLLANLAEQADGTAKLGFKVINSLVTAALPLIPGGD